MEKDEKPQKLHILTVDKYPNLENSIRVSNKEELFDYCRDNCIPVFKVDIKGYGVLAKTLYFIKFDDEFWLYHEEVNVEMTIAKSI